MKNGTLGQAAKILSVFEETPGDRIQAILASGLLADLRDGNVAEVKRDDFRRLLGMAPLVPEPTVTPYAISVDYGMSLAGMIAAGKYDRVNPDITVEHFPIKRRGKADRKALLVHFNHYMEDGEVTAEFDRLGFYDGAIEDLLALGAKYPDLQREFPIVAWNSVWRDLGFSGCPYLGRFGGERSLDLGVREHRWDGCCRFLAFRK